MATALLAYNATVRTNQRPSLTIEQLLGDGSIGAADHALNASEMIEAIELPPPERSERAAYKRAIGRAYAEWPLVEVVARVVVANGAFEFVRLTAGGVAPVPIRLTAAEAATQGAPVSPATIAAAAGAATRNAKPLPMTTYKLDLLSGLVQDLLEQCSR
jgi:xanthine dehydrogenase YagS FAD-binding subunit